MAPATPQRSRSRGRNVSLTSTPGTPESGYHSVSEDTPTRGGPSAGCHNQLGRASMDSDVDDEPLVFNLQHARRQVEETTTAALGIATSASSESGHTERPDASGSGIPRSNESAAGSVSGSTSQRTLGSFSSSTLEMLENDEVTDVEFDFDDEEAGMEDGYATDPGAPLVSRGRRRRRTRWSTDDDEGGNKEQSLFELIPPLLLAHPLPFLPLLALLPYNFLPAGVVLFIPFICVLTLLSSCAHIVIVYLAWYLKVPSFEDVFAQVIGTRFGRYGRLAGRAAVIMATTGMLVGWLATMFPLLQPVVETYLPKGFLTSGIVWTIAPALLLLPSLLPSRMTRSLKRSQVFLALLLPIVAFLVIGRTSEIHKATLEAGQPPDSPEPSDAAEEVVGQVAKLVKRKFGLAAGGSAGAGLTTLTLFLSPHLNSLPIHRTLSRNKRASFPVPCLLSSAILLALSLPFALVPYYLLPALPETALEAQATATSAATPMSISGVFARLPSDDDWVNLARVLQCILGLATCNQWIIRGRDSILGGLGVERGERYRIGRWVGLALWFVVVLLACIGGWVAEKIQVLGIIATLAVCWLLPSVFFIITFHVRSPLSIVFPSRNPPPPGPLPETPSRPDRRHGRSNSLSDPSTDALLARKERQLQKRRLERRLWQDLIVYVGILPVGCVAIAWSLGNLIGVW